MQMLQERNAEHAIESVDANLAIRPVIHWPPAQPVSIFGAAKDPRFLAGRNSRGRLARQSIHAIGEEDGASEAMIHEPLPGSSIEIKLQAPLPITGFDLITDQLLQKLSR